MYEEIINIRELIYMWQFILRNDLNILFIIISVLILINSVLILINIYIFLNFIV